MLNKPRKLILDTLFPIECLGCGKEGVWLCPECFDKLKVKKGYFETNDLELSHIDGFFVAADWQDKVLQEVIHKYKYNFATELNQPLSKLLIKKMALMFEIYDELKDFVVVPVPLHRRRRAWRGFNQAELLARRVAQKFNLQYDDKTIKRKKYTRAQVGLSSKKRNKNIKEAFGMNGRDAINRVSTKNYLLIDDVLTTGVTMNEVARVLKKHGAGRVWGLALARG